MVSVKTIISTLTLAMIVSSCGPDLKNCIYADSKAPVFPDIDSVEIPINIAPLNVMPIIEIANRCSDVYISYTANGKTIDSHGEHATSINTDDWRDLLSDAKEIEATIALRIDGQWEKYPTLHLFVTQDPIEEYLVYRKIAPGYESYNQHGIYQRSLTTGKEHVIMNNDRIGFGCMNCHSFANHHADNMSIHLRGGSHPGTLMRHNGKTDFIKVDHEKLGGSYVYPNWHKDGRHITYSTNHTHQSFHTAEHKRIEVFDDYSNVVIVDTDTEEFITNSILFNDSTFTTFPNFSADGKWLYFCKSKTLDKKRDITNLHYDICRIAYDAETNTLADNYEVVIDASSEGKSASLPHCSPDGRYLTYCYFDYGQFPIYHKESDIYILDLETNEISKANDINSDDVESYNSWTADGKWLAFSTKRGDGAFARPYFAHFNSETGKFSKPFAMPIDHIQDYIEEYYTYNIPEFIKDEISTREIAF
ncbi:MAG: cytochrome C biosynthesis protein [Bacteroidales bacterium]|nr:cytochrome C biosynthesis protein [Bacteroidales bacterium]